MKCFKYSFLFELVSQEIPAEMQKAACLQLICNFTKFSKNFFIFLSPKFFNQNALDCLFEKQNPEEIFEKIQNFDFDKDFNVEDFNAKLYFSSSRIAFKAELLIFQIYEKKIIKGPPLKKSESDFAFQKFLEKNHASSDDIQIIKDKGVEYYAISQDLKLNSDIQQIKENLSKSCCSALKEFKWPNSLFYQGSDGCSWIRPLLNILAIFEGNDKIARNLDFEFAKIKSSSQTLGHKILSVKNFFDFKANKFEISRIADYSFLLKQNFVMVWQEERFCHLLNSAKEKAEIFCNYLEKDSKIFKNSALHIKKLFEQLICIADWPNILVCQIQKEFMVLPKELIEYVMISNQRYIPLLDSDSILNEKFLVVIDHDKASIEMKIGYEKVLFARLLDAKFFFERFLKSDPYEIFEKKLKKKESEFSCLSIFDLNSKIFEIAKKIICKNSQTIILEKKFLDAAKIDLCFELVFEYPALRGFMSSYFWKNQTNETICQIFGLSNSTKEMQKFHEKIYSIGKNIYFNAGEVYQREILDCNAIEARIFGIAEKIIRLQYFFFEKKQNPTGSKDPFALKRDINNFFEMILKDSIDFEKKSIKNSFFDLDFYEIFLEFDLYEKESQKNLFDFIYKNLSTYIFNYFFEFCSNSPNFTKEFLKNLVNFIVNDLYLDKNSKILFFTNRQILNPLKICETILYFLNLKNFISSDFKDSFKRLSQIYLKKYSNFLKTQEFNPLFDLKEENDMFEFCLQISDELKNIDDQKTYIAKILEKKSEISNLINSFFDNVYIEDEDQEKKNKRIFLIKKLFDIIELKFSFSKFFELF